MPSSSPFRITSIFPLSHLPSTPTLSQIHQTHAQLVLHGHATSRAALSHLLAFCATSLPSPPLPPYPLLLFSRLQTPSVFASNNLLRCLPPISALAFYASFRRSPTPTNNYTFTFALHACAPNDSTVLRLEGLQVHADVVRLGQDGDVFVRNALLHFYCAGGRVEDGRRVFEEMPHRRDVVTWNVMVAGYARVGRMDVCEELFGRMPKGDIVTWSTMIMGYVQGGSLERALMLFRDMRRAGVVANESTLVSVLSASAQLGLLENGKFIHSEIKRSKFPVTLRVGTALVDMYAKCGCIAMSKRVFDEMPLRDVFAWNSMLCGLASHGLGTEVLGLLRTFLGEGLQPTSVTFVAVLNACGRTGLVEDGRRFLEEMTTIYGIEPEMEHYGCMVDMFGRAGLVSEAIELVENMKIPPDPVLWGTLLGACKVHGLVELGVKIGNKLIELEPAHDGHYVLLAGIYAKARKWEDVAKVRKLMTQRGTTKVAGWSLIEAQGTVHKFVSGGRDHERSSEIHKMNELVDRRLAEAGYLPDVSPVLHDIGEEEKVQAIKVHSERLAIAFGLLVVEAGRPIRIVKNLRVCGDCHEVSKMISKVFEREIIVRDGSRFHHFRDGTCSCNDYW